MIFLEFGQIVRVNYTTDLFFLYLVRDGQDVWLFPLEEEIASGKSKVPFDVPLSQLRILSFKEIKHLEILMILTMRPTPIQPRLTSPLLPFEMFPFVSYLLVPDHQCWDYRPICLWVRQ